METFEIPNGFWGVLGDGASDQDYRLGGGLSLPIPRHTWETSGHIQYDQSKSRSPVSSKQGCTILSRIGCTSDLTSHVFSEEEIKQILAQAVIDGFKPTEGWTLQESTKTVIKYYSAKYEPLLYFRVNLTSSDFLSALEKGYTVQVGYRGNADYNFDFRTDGDLDKTSFGAATYGHAIRTIVEPMNFKMVDNYFKASNAHNTYIIPKENLGQLVANNVFYEYGYVACYKKDFEEMNIMPNIPLWGTKAYEAAQKAIKAGKLTDGGIDDLVGTPALEEDLVKLGILTSKLGTLSRLRWWEALRRMKLIS